jgi:hypothetical protein
MVFDRMKEKVKITCLSCLFLFVLSTGTASPQNSSNLFTAELNIKFDGAELKRLERAADLLNDADLLLAEANNQYSVLTDLEKKERVSSSYNSALKKLFESSETYKEAYGLAFSVFNDKNQNFWQKMNRSNHRASGMEKARYYEGSALKCQNRSLIRRQQVMESDRFEYSLEIMNDAVEYEKLAVRDQGRALQICVDYPVEYNYGWDDDKSLEEIVQIMKDPIVHEPPEDIFATVNTETKVDSALLKEIIFKVQIAAHTVPLSAEYLNLIYKGDIPIDMIYEEDWYKYSIGRYKTLDEAEATRRESNIKKAFVVAYREGRKISTQDAQLWLEKQKTAEP